ncbi:hypothetical protein Q7C_1234 [Methylophaga frappieri]|uniref:YecA family protein n=2 Tax=Methylophaga frappieri (strain ATCC BAA-2434 / DSM 25690 / JAM7) TaxID=754477 RepID=I1YHJ1_METFJ|nr:hypothetical protein Q7C_1234 [Methylophaga frappieri]
MDPQASRYGWYHVLFEDYQPGAEEQQNLTLLFDETIQALNSLDFALDLSLPDDDSPLGSRVVAMADWCQGLLYGLAVAGLTDTTSLSKDCQEYVTDVIQISQINDVDLDESEHDESNFAELVEYLRMGLFLLFGELSPDENQDEQTEH